MKKLLYTFLLVGSAGSQLGATDCGRVLRDPGFDLWCGDSLCAWKLERGAIQKIPTWNAGDPGVELVGDDVAIEQLSPVDSASCIELSLIANVDQNADVSLNFDVYGDGTVEHTERIPSSSWKPLSFLVAFQTPYEGIRFEIAKQGSGRAQLAQIEATTHDPQDCAGFAPIVPAPAPNGAVCGADMACRSGLCEDTGGLATFCVGCDLSGHGCPSGQVCGVGAPLSPVYAVPMECVGIGSHQLGELCLADTECATGICEGFFCSTCRADGTGCLSSETCGPAWPVDPNVNPNGLGPHVCQPNAHARQSGQPCASDADCASAACDGTARMQCDDGRACSSAAQCPFGTPDTQNGLQNGPCNIVGVQGGTCR
jgi:hypothetical protein